MQGAGFALATSHGRLEGAEIVVARFSRREGDTAWFVAVPVSSKATVVGMIG